MIARVLPAVCKVEGVLRGVRVSSGSGFVVSGDGLVVTNHHVIAGAVAAGCHELRVSFDDGRVFRMTPLAADAEADIAVGRLAAPPLVQLKPFSLCADNGIPASSIGISCATQPDCLVTVGMGGNQWQNNCVAGHCVVPTCTDGVADGDESDVDCGGSCSNDLDSVAVGLWCASGKKCRSGADCQSAICTASVCN